MVRKYKPYKPSINSLQEPSSGPNGTNGGISLTFRFLRLPMEEIDLAFSN
jgi:hypothetical protein